MRPRRPGIGWPHRGAGGRRVVWVRLGAGVLALFGGMVLLRRVLAGAALPGLGPRTPRALALLAGAAAAALLQSASFAVAGIAAATDSGGVPLAQGFAAVAGANLGGALLSQLTAYAPPRALLAALALLGGSLCLHRRLRRAGAALLALAMLSAGFGLIARPGPGGLPAAGVLRAAAAGPPGAFLAGLALTAVLFSSGFTIAVAQGLAAAGALPLRAGLAFVCGANVGTTSDVLLAALGLGPRGRAAALFHLGFKLLGASAGLLLAGPMAAALAGAGVPAARALAHAHAALNLASAVLLWPMIPGLADLAARRAPGGPGGIRR